MCITAENVHELLPAADQFNIEGIVFKCCKFLEENLEPENCIGVRNVSSSKFVKPTFPAFGNGAKLRLSHPIFSSLTAKFVGPSVVRARELLGFGSV